MCVATLSLSGNGMVNAFPRQRLPTTIEELLDASFSVMFVWYQTKAGDYFFPEVLVINTQTCNAMAEVATSLPQTISSEHCARSFTQTVSHRQNGDIT
jgi:uncharacterized membrane protein